MGTYSYTGAPQFLTVSKTGEYDIVAFGAQGGAVFGGSTGGYGAEVGGTFELTAGEKLEIVVGGAGGYGQSLSGDGGGGSFVLANVNGAYRPILVAGGGGGARGSSDGGSGTLMPGNGQGGGAGTGLYSGAGGAGVKSSGANGTSNGDLHAGGGSNRSGNYAGGYGTVGSGGFGGGGGGINGGGGGGGYSGGAGGAGYTGGSSGSQPGGGGGSYDGGVPNSSQTAAGENPGNGRVIILPNAVTTSPPVVVAETRSVVSGQTVSVPAANGALQGDSDPNGGTLSVDWVSFGKTAIAKVPTSGSATIAGAFGALTLSADGAYSYVASNGLDIVTAPDGAPITDTFKLYIGGSEGTQDVTSTLAIGVSLAADGAETVTNASGSDTFTIGATTLTLNETAATSYGGIIQDGTSGNVGGNVVVSGSAPLTLTGVSTYTGKTSVSGTLALASTASIHASSKVSLTTSGAMLDISQAPAGEVINKLGGVAGTVADLGNRNLKIKVQPGIVDTFAGSIQDGGIAGGTGASLTLGGPGKLLLAGANTYTGATTLDAGTLALSGAGSIATSSGLSLAAGSTFDMSGETAASIGTLSGVSGALVDLGAGTLTVNETTGTTFAGVIQNGGGAGGTGGNLAIAGAALTLTGASTYTGKTSVSGTLDLAGTASIHASTKVALTTSSATLDISQATAGEVINKLGGVAGTVADLGNQNLKIKVQGGTVDTFAGTIEDGGSAGGTGSSLTLGGLGELSLTHANSYTGGTTIAAGTLDIAALGAAAKGTITFANPASNGVATLEIDAAALTSVTPTLPVAHQYNFANSIAGATSANQVIDLTSLAYVQGSMSATLAGTTLNVDDGTADVTLHLASAQSKSSFATASDGHGGTLVYDPPATTKHAAATARIDTRWIEMAMADFGGVSGEGHAHASLHDPYGPGAAADHEHRHGHIGSGRRAA